MTGVDTALILAGGRGSRLLPLTAATPKPMLPFCGAPLLAGMIRRLAPHGIRHVVLVVGSDPTPFRSLAEYVAPDGVTVAVATESVPLDTAGGVRLAARGLDRPYLVLNGDVLNDLDVSALIAHHVRERADATLDLVRVTDTSAYGVCVRDGGRIVRFVEKPAPGSLPGHDTINAGTYVLAPGLLDRFPDGPLSFERTVFPGLLEADLVVAGHVGTGTVWSDLGTPERLLEGQRIVLGGGVAWPPLADVAAGPDGVRRDADVVVAPSARLVGPVLLGRGVRIAAEAVVGPDTVLGAGVTVGAEAQVTGAWIGEGVDLGAGVVIDRALVGRRVQVGTGSRVGAAAVIGDGGTIAPATVVAPGSRQPSPDAAG